MLQISPRTVETYLASIQRKLRVESRSGIGEIVMKAASGIAPVWEATNLPNRETPAMDEDDGLTAAIDRATEVIGDRQEAMRWLGTPVGIEFRLLQYSFSPPLAGAKARHGCAWSIPWSMEPASCLTVARICSARFPSIDGEGARLYGGDGIIVGYVSFIAPRGTSLCALEVLANSGSLPRDMVLIEIVIPTSASMEAVELGTLPKGWDGAVPADDTHGSLGWNGNPTGR